MKAIRKIKHSSLRLKTFLVSSALVIFIGLHLYLGADAIRSTKVTTFVGVYEIYFNGLLRLVFPILVTLLAASQLQSHLSSNFVAFTRARESFRHYLLSSLSLAIFRNALFFMALGLSTLIAVDFYAPTSQPGLVDPTPFGLSEKEALIQVARQNPLGWLASWGPITYGFVLTAWLVLASIALSLLSFAVILFVRQRFALLVPFALYILETLVFQLNDLPKYGLFASMPTPISMQNYNLLEAITPLIAIGFLSSAAIVYKIRISEQTGEFS